jgi:hypothetical protein
MMKEITLLSPLSVKLPLNMIQKIIFFEICTAEVLVEKYKLIFTLHIRNTVTVTYSYLLMGLSPS